MAPEEIREPSLNELCTLSVLGNLAYAARCARRIQPRFQLPPEQPDRDEIKAAVDEAIRWAEGYVQTGAGPIERGQWLADAILAVAEASYEFTDYSAFAAHHAVRGAVFVARSGETLSAEDFLEVVATAYGASRVLLANAPKWINLLVKQTLRADFDKLLARTLDNASQRGERFDPTSSGPLGDLWQGKTPTW